jgi:hypothetical protein
VKPSSTLLKSKTDWVRLRSTKVKSVPTEEHPEADVKHVGRGIVRRGLKPAPSEALVSLRLDQGWSSFAVPMLTGHDRAELARCAKNILLASEAYFLATIANLYDPDTMPKKMVAKPGTVKPHNAGPARPVKRAARKSAA